MSRKNIHRLLQPIIKSSLFVIHIILTGLFLTGCTTATTTEIPQGINSPEPALSKEQPLPSKTPLSPHEPLPQSPGPFLLIQSDLTQYQIIDISSKSTRSFDPPEADRQYKLSSNLSPSKRLIFFPLSSREIALVDLPSGEIIATHSRFNRQPKFDIEQAIEEAKTLLKENFYSDEALSALVEDSYQKSLNDIRWYQNDNQWLVAAESTPTSTNLNIYSLETQSFDQLENQPGLVLDYWFGPGGSQVLLKKGFSNDPSLWQGFRYYVLDINSREITSIPFPAGNENPTLFWVDPGKIGIIHQMTPIGGSGFSVFDLKSRETNQLIEGSFSYIGSYMGNLLWIRENQSEKNTTFTLSTLEGEIIHQKTIDQRCFYKGRLDDQILLNCEENSLLLNDNLEVNPFGPIVSLLVQGSGGTDAIIVTRDGQTYRIDLDNMERELLELEGIPLEIRWLPDGRGFLYRLSGELFLYNPETGISSLLLRSQIFGDYLNINAVWINLE